VERWRWRPTSFAVATCREVTAMRIGAHVSIEGGIGQAIERAVTIGAETIQFFASPPQSWRAPFHRDEAIAAFHERRLNAGIDPIFLHSVYLINLASANSFIREQSMKSLIAYLEWGHRLHVDGVIAHLGSARDVGFTNGLALVVDALNRVLDAAEGDVPLLMETTAGPGSIIGANFAELGSIITALGRHERLQVCLDTAHVFAAGLYDGTAASLETLLDTFEREIGLERLRAIHLNDSLSPFASRVDRHANIGAGKLGASGLRHVLTHPKLRHLPFLLEVPGPERKGPDRANVDLAKELALGAAALGIALEEAAGT
jgi:deoxyribonuclease IV